MRIKFNSQKVNCTKAVKGSKDLKNISDGGI
jgi:hypothetical protein